MDARIRQRRASVRREQRQKRLRRTIVVLAVLSLAAVLWTVERSPLVALANVVVEGNVELTSDEIRDEAGLVLGTSTLRLDLSAARDRVEAMPEIADATVNRVDAVTVRITVTERVAHLRVHTPRKKWVVDEEGVVFRRGEGPRQMQVVLLEREVSLGATAEETGLAEVVAVHAGLSGPLRARVVAYRLEDNDDVVLLLEGNLIARLGDSTQLDEKVRALGALLEEIEGTNASMVDVRVPSRPVVARR